MVIKRHIESNLNALVAKFNSASTPKEELFYSKLAIIELCGWIEETMDDIVMSCARRKLKDTHNIIYVEKDIISTNFGFEYKQHFRGMLIRLIGLIAFEKIENKISPSKLQKLKGALTILKKARNSQAHTHLKGVLTSIDAPSVTKNNFTLVYDGLKEFDQVLRKEFG